MKSSIGGNCSRLPVFRFNVGIRGCVYVYDVICRFVRFVEFVIVGILVGEKGERKMKSIS